MRERITWIVVADGARGRILVPAADHSGYCTLRSFDSAAARARAHVLGSAKPGRAHESATAARHSIKPRKDLYAAAKTVLAEEIATILNEGAARRAFDQLVLVALPRTALALGAALDRDVAQRIVQHIGKDLTNASDEAVSQHVAAAKAEGAAA